MSTDRERSTPSADDHGRMVVYEDNPEIDDLFDYGFGVDEETLRARRLRNVLNEAGPSDQVMVEWSSDSETESDHIDREDQVDHGDDLDDQALVLVRSGTKVYKGFLGGNDKYNPPTILDMVDIGIMRSTVMIGADVECRVPDKFERPDWDYGEWMVVYAFMFREGFRFPFPPLMSAVCNYYEVAPSQLMPNAVRVVLSVERLPELYGIGVDLEEFLNLYYLKEHTEKGRLFFVCRDKGRELIKDIPTNYRYWKNRYFLIKGKESFAPGSPSFPLNWKTLGMVARPSYI